MVSLVPHDYGSFLKGTMKPFCVLLYALGDIYSIGGVACLIVTLLGKADESLRMLQSGPIAHGRQVPVYFLLLNVFAPLSQGASSSNVLLISFSSYL